MQRKKRSLKKKGAPAPKPADAHPKRRRRVRIRLNTKLRNAITSFLSSHSGASADQIRKELKMGHATIVRALTRMQSTGDVTSTGNGRRHWYLVLEKNTMPRAGRVVPQKVAAPAAHGGDIEGRTSVKALALHMKLLAQQMVETADLLLVELERKDKVLEQLSVLFSK